MQFAGKDVRIFECYVFNIKRVCVCVWCIMNEVGLLPVLGPTVITVSHSGCGLHTPLSAAAHLTPVPLSLYPSFRMSLLLPCLPHLLILPDPLSLLPLLCSSPPALSFYGKTSSLHWLLSSVVLPFLAFFPTPVFSVSLTSASTVLMRSWRRHQPLLTFSPLL